MELVRLRSHRGIGLAAILALASCASSPPPAASSPPTSETTSAESARPSPAPASAASAPAGSAAPPATPATPSDVLATARSHFDSCYTQARAADPRLGRTTVAITFMVDPSGAPTTVDLHYRNRFDDAAKECMRDAALAVRFPASMQGTQSGTIAFAPPQ